MPLDLIIRNGLVSTDTLEREPVEIGIAGGKIVRLAPSIDEEAADVVDASGRDIFPGFIDPHTHMELPVSGTVSSDDFFNGTVAAACGGITTIVDFASAAREQSLMEALNIWHSRAGPKAVVDYGFHTIVPEMNGSQLDEMRTLVEEGVNTFKCMMAYKRGPQGSGDANLLRMIWKAGEVGGLPMVHAENGDAIDVTVDRFLAQGRVEPRWHPMTRPSILEAEAVNRAATLAALAESPMYIVHLSSRAALEEVCRAREKDWQIMAETCPQYLTLTDREYQREGFEAAKYVCSPPLREDADRTALWEGIEDSDLQLVASDHCPFFYKGQKDRGLGNFSLIPNGIPTIQSMFSILFSEGMTTGRISRQQFIELSSTNAARIFGMYPRKGSISEGSDADIVIYDPERRVTLSRQDPASPLRERVDYTPYEGMSVTGWPDSVISRGEVIVRSGKPTELAVAGRGKFVSRRGGQWTGWG